MTQSFAPETAEEVRAIVADALASGTSLEVVGGATRRTLGRPVDAEYVLSSAGLAGVSLYEPDELVLRAGPGTSMEQIRLQTEQHGQMLAFEPPDYGPLLGGGAGQGTLGGIVATNLAGPRRVKAGAARDHFLGFTAVSGRGESFKSGGRVVKNVTGYDLCKLMCGSWGTLGVMTEITVKVLPAPQKTRTVLVRCDDPAAAVRAMTDGLSSPHDVSAAAWVPGDIARLSGASHVAGAGGGVVALRLEGIGVSVSARCASLSADLDGVGDIGELHTHNSLIFWREIRDVAPFAGEAARAVWKISVPPSAAAATLASCRAAMDLEIFMDWGGGLLWIATEDEAAAAGVIRAAAAACGGHAMLVRGGEALRRAPGAFQPEPPGVARLTRNIKQAFDPKGILNPGRMFEGV